jgi:hypothetical protein
VQRALNAAVAAMKVARAGVDQAGEFTVLLRGGELTAERIESRSLSAHFRNRPLTCLP